MELTEFEKNELEKLNDNLVLLNVLKKIFLDDDIFLSTKNLIETHLVTNEILGEYLRADVRAIVINQNAFKEIEKYKKITKQAARDINPAR